MTLGLEKSGREVFNLPETEPAFLADRLLSSLGGEILGDVDAAWVAEAEERYVEYKDGKRKPIPSAGVLAEADRIIG